jgi:hypothetical protein
MSEIAALPPAVTPVASTPPGPPAASPPPPTPFPENSRQFPIPEKNSAQPPPPPPPPPLTPRQQAALARLLAGEPLGDIARALQIDPKTLYNWRRTNPTFVAELTRRQRDLWLDISDDLRTTVAAGVGTLRGHLVNPSPMTQLRAARLLINLVNAPRLAPTGPTTVEGVLDEMLRDRTPPPATPEQAAQRRALLDQFAGDPDA